MRVAQTGQQSESESESDSDEGPYNPWDGPCPYLQLVFIMLVGLLKTIVMAPLCLMILFPFFGLSMIICCASTLLYSLFTLLTFHRFPEGMNSQMQSFGPCSVDGIWKARIIMLLFPTICMPLGYAMLFLLLCVAAPVLAVMKPLMDTYTAWRWQAIFGIGGFLSGQQDYDVWVNRFNDTSDTRPKRKGKSCHCWSRALPGFLNGFIQTLTVLIEAYCIGIYLPVLVIGLFMGKLWEWSTYEKLFVLPQGAQGSDETFMAREEHLAWEAFFQEMLLVGKAAIHDGLITTQECQELDAFLMIGLPALVLLRFVTRTMWDEEGDKPVKELLGFLTKVYRDQGDGLFEYEAWTPWDGHHIIVEDLSDLKAEEQWREAKEIVEEQPFWYDEDEAEEVNEYAIFEAVLLYGERPDNSKLRGKGQKFLKQYEELPKDRRLGINHAASKIREVVLTITKAPSFHPRHQKVMEELGRQRCWCCSSFSW
eukprot:gnl/MRDRNA2_/MRDRNA2_62518_c0_seq2.p1 gnl/MRDRNA2_/MRDRNA2_62518_c0~~gnl/MRDRNA2_/MRDRNA2_62518_c0_seq2.p1  ORF type:complete len:480 (-),score=73.22 gnl/MRDRNA2_/MRDRNA2_62518_c0_seq2:112-1551(-)